jgi:hypothetical protein
VQYNSIAKYSGVSGVLEQKCLRPWLTFLTVLKAKRKTGWEAEREKTGTRKFWFFKNRVDRRGNGSIKFPPPQSGPYWESCVERREGILQNNNKYLK